MHNNIHFFLRGNPRPKVSNYYKQHRQRTMKKNTQIIHNKIKRRTEKKKKKILKTNENQPRLTFYK